MSTEQSESVPVAITAPQVEAKPAPSAVTAPQVETNAAPATDTTQQPTTLTATTQRVKDPKHVAAGKMVAERNRLAREEQKKAAEAYYAEKQAKPATAAPKPASVPTNGSLWVALVFPFPGSITSVKSSWQWPSLSSTN